MPGLCLELDPDAIRQFDQFAIDARAHKTYAREPFHHVTKLTFLLANDWREEHDSCAWRQGQDRVHDVAGSLRHDRHAGVRAIRLADVRIKEAQVIVNLG